MSILYNEKNKVFNLQTKNTSYQIHIFKDKYLLHMYWGKKIRDINPENALPARNIVFSANPDSEDKSYSLNAMPLEYPCGGGTDFRNSAIDIIYPDGSKTTDLIFDSYEIVKGKPALEGLPSTYIESDEEADTLLITLIDKYSHVRVVLRYCVYNDRDVITRNSIIYYDGKENDGEYVFIDNALSTSIDFSKDYKNYKMLRLQGAWGRERHVEICDLPRGLSLIESKRGASSHQVNPFLALLNKNTDEDNGEVYALNFVYSGNFKAGIEVDEQGRPRMFMGLNNSCFSWKLHRGESFITPEVVMVYSANGLGNMSRIFHDLYRKRLVRGVYRDLARPILVNNWEGTYFDFNEEKILDIGKVAKELGIELLVLDDGWFGQRNDDSSSLGDWFDNKEKLPNGISGLAKKIHELGLKFGLWFEPEMISVISKLYDAHPDWCIRVPWRPASQCRNQLILDLSRKEVTDYIINAVSNVLDNAEIDYVKWDMNRHMTEVFSQGLVADRQGELSHRYMLGLYHIMETITSKYPNILFESCSGGGGRFDPGMFYYMPQAWCSDDTDAIERLSIQYGTSMVYPTSTMGAHISAVPNHQVGRVTPLETRGNVAMSGTFGYELDLTNFTDEEKEIVKKQVKLYKELRSFISNASLYRIGNPQNGHACAFEFVSQEGNKVFAQYFRILQKVNIKDERLKFKGLEANADYVDIKTKQVWHGDELMEIGLIPEWGGDFTSEIFMLEKVQ